MAITTPPDLARGKVSWTVGRTDGSTLPGARGTVRFEATAVAVSYSTATVLPSPVETPVVDGTMTPVDLLVNDPEIWNWKVTPHLGVTWPEFHIDVAGPVNLASAAVVPGKGPVRAVKGEQGFQGRSLTLVSQVNETLLRLDLEDPATGEGSTEYFELARGPEGPYGGTEVTAPQVADMVATNPAVRDALDQSYRRGFSVKEWGAKGDGTTDDTLAIQAAADVVHSDEDGAALYFPEGTYRTTATLRIRGNLDGTSGTILSDHPGVAVQLGDDTAPGIRMSRKTLSLPHIVHPKTATGWDGSSVGVRAVNLDACTVHVPLVQDFDIGFYLYGNGQGAAYNTIHVGHLANNKVNLRLGAGTGGWANQNVFLGGRYGHNSSEGTNVTGARHVKIDAPEFPVNTNLWLNPSLEGNTPQFHLELGGTANVILNGRYEVDGGARIRWGADSFNNQILYGYQASGIIETWDPAASPTNIIVASGWSRRVSPGPAVLENSVSATSPVDVVMASGATQSGASTETGYTVTRSATETRMKRTTDAHPRIQIAHQDGVIRFGTGVAAPAVAVGVAGTRLRFDSVTTTAAPGAGGAGVLPSTPAGYLQVYLEGAVRNIPYY